MDILSNREETRYEQLGRDLAPAILVAPMAAYGAAPLLPYVDEFMVLLWCTGVAVSLASYASQFLSGRTRRATSSEIALVAAAYVLVAVGLLTTAQVEADRYEVQCSAVQARVADMANLDVEKDLARFQVLECGKS